jgi:hypothetical protein
MGKNNKEMFEIFVEKVVGVFFKKKKEKIILGKRVVRGRAICSAGEIENIIAKTIAHIIPKKYRILVDQDLSINIAKKSKLRSRKINPDIAIVLGKTNIIVGIIEIKIDLQYLDHSWQKSYLARIKDINNAKTFGYTENTGTPESKPGTLFRKNKIKSAIIVLTPKSDRHHLPLIRKKEKNCFALLQGEHPNCYDKKRWEVIKDNLSEENVDKSDWDQLVNYLRVNY